MTHTYSQRSLMVLSLLGILSAIMSILSVILIFQLQSQQTARKDSPNSSIVPTHIWAVMLPVSTVLSALSLTLNLSSVGVCLLQNYFSTEICRGEQDTERADWFLLESRGVRTVAIGLFCLGVSVYMAAMSIYMLLIFEVETGIASACVLSSGILTLLVVVMHSLVKVSQTARHYPSDRPDTLYQNQHGGNGTPGSRPCDLDRPGTHPASHRSSQSLLQRQMCPPCKPSTREQQHRQYSAQEGTQGHASDNEGYSSNGSCSQMHRTPSTESGLLQAQTKPWNGVNNEMRSVLARKSGLSAKDSTLV